MIVKICGVTTLDNALMVARAGADMLGLNFYPPSPRALAPSVATLLAEGLRSALGDHCPRLVGVFVNESPSHIQSIMEQVGLDYAQLSGDEPLEILSALKGRAFKSIRPSSLEEAVALTAGWALPTADEGMPSILLDAYHPNLYGGTGHSATLEVARATQQRASRMMLAGGLTPENVAERVREIQPWGVDVASGVENPNQPGIKDPNKVKQFIANAKSPMSLS